MTTFSYLKLWILIRRDHVVAKEPAFEPFQEHLNQPLIQGWLHIVEVERYSWWGRGCWLKGGLHLWTTANKNLFKNLPLKFFSVNTVHDVEAWNLKIISSLYSRCYTQACNKLRTHLRGFSAWAAQLRRNIAAVESRWRDYVRFDRPGNRIPDLPHQ